MSLNFNARAADSGSLFCLVCEKEIRDGNWFARIKLDDGRAAFCRPQCVEIFLENREACAHKRDSGGSIIPLNTTATQLLAA